MSGYDSIVKQSVFQKLRTSGKKIYAKDLVSYLTDNSELSKPNLGFIVSKKVSTKAVLRNKVKRRLRALFRSIILLYNLQGYTIVVVARSSILEAEFSSLEHEFKRIFRSLGHTVQGAANPIKATGFKVRKG